MKALLTILILAACTCAPRLHGQTLTHPWSVTDCGGAGAEAPGFTLLTSIGQACTETGSGDDLGLLAGFIPAQAEIASLTVLGVEGHAGVEGFSLAQNYPNPFSGRTTIRYAIPSAALVTLSVTNVLGQEIYSREIPHGDGGSYTAMFSSHGLPSGAYFFRMRASDHFGRTLFDRMINITITR